MQTDRTTEKSWFKSYPKGVPREINPASYRNIPAVFDDACKKFRAKPAFSNMGATLTFGDLDRLSTQFASYLQNDLGMKKGDRIAIQMPNLLQYPIALFGSLKAGLIIVNTNPLYTPREMEHQFRDSGVTTVVILANFAKNLQEVLPHLNVKNVIVTEIGDQLPFPKSLLVNSVVKYVKKMVPAYNIPTAIRFTDALAKGLPSKFKPVDIAPEDIAFLQYTGGTTGVSKGAVLTNRNIIANMEQVAAWMAPRLVEGEEIIITALPLYHIFSLSVNCLSFMKYGTHNILITNPRDIPGFIKELKKWKFTTFAGVNTLFNALMNHPEFKTIDFSHLKISVAGAMALQTPVAKRWKEITGSPVIEGYGLTEASPVVSVNPVDGTDRVGTIGLPVSSTDIKICDDDGNIVPEGEPGELCCRGPQVMQGYYNRPDETEKVIKDGWLFTGDVAVNTGEGFFKIVDRKKDMILVSGFNVYPNEVEDVIATHPGVQEVAAVGVPDEHSGEIVKIVVVKKNESLTSEELIKFAKERLTGYKVPKQVEFRKELPKTNVGKILRRALRG